MEDYVKYYKQMIFHRTEVYANIANMTIYVIPSVFDPDPTITYTSMFIIKNLMTLDLTDKTILDIGCGTGVLGLYCLKQGAKHVCFVDNNEIAMRNTLLNTSNYINKTVMKSELFHNIKKTKYDIILFNFPICDGDWNKDNIDTLKKYCKNLKSYMHETTYAFSVFASFGNTTMFEEMLKKYKFTYTTTPETRFCVEWMLFTIKRDISHKHHGHHKHHHHKHHKHHEHSTKHPNTKKPDTPQV